MSEPVSRPAGATAPSSTGVELRRRIDSGDIEVARLAGVAMDPRTRAVLAGAKTDLRFAAEYLRLHSAAVDLQNLGVWLDLVERRLRLVALAIDQFGPAAQPPKFD